MYPLDSSFDLVIAKMVVFIVVALDEVANMELIVTEVFEVVSNQNRVWT